MNTEAMLADLQKHLREWERNSAGPDFNDRREWVRGVIHGIRITIHRVTQHVAAPPAIRGTSGGPY
jgi:hypothetical protein